MVFLLLLLKPFLAVIRAEYVTLMRKIHLPDAGQHLDHTAQLHLHNNVNKHFIELGNSRKSKFKVNSYKVFNSSVFSTNLLLLFSVLQCYSIAILTVKL